MLSCVIVLPAQGATSLPFPKDSTTSDEIGIASAIAFAESWHMNKKEETAKMEHQHQLMGDNEENIFDEGRIPKAFQDLDETFRCRICSRLFNKAVSIKECGHTFCSVCIRSYWMEVRSGTHRQERSCPLCRRIVGVMDVDKALVMNRSVQDSVKCFKQLLLSHHRSSTTNDPHSIPSGCDTQRRRKKRKASENVYYNEDGSEKKNGVVSICCRNDDLQDLPIKRKMQPRNYARMKKTELRRLCKEYDIPTTGTEQDLMDRMRKFQSMWNAEVDGIDPKTPSDLAAELKNEMHAQQEEKNRALFTGAAGNMKCIEKLNENIKSGNVTSGNIDFDKKMKANFNSLVNQLRERMKKDSGSSTSPSKAFCDEEYSHTEDDKHASDFSNRIEGQICAKESTESSSNAIHLDSSSDDTERNLDETRMKLRSAVITKNKQNAFARDSLSPNVLPSSAGQKFQARKKLKSATIITCTGSASDERKPAKRSSPLPPSVHTNRVNWACDRCTFINLGIDYICQMCSYRKT